MNLKKSIKKRVDKLMDRIHRHLAPSPLRTYSHILSLGFNCEIAFQFLKFNGFLESNLLNWFYTDSTTSLKNALISLDTVGADFHFDRHFCLWKDSNHSLYFHGRGNHRVWKEGAAPHLLDEDKAELTSRVAYLKEKLLRLAQSEDSVLFAYKPPVEELKDSSTAVSGFIQTRNALAGIGFKKFDLMIIVTHETSQAIKEELLCREPASNIFIESIAFHAPLNTVTEGPFDLKGWRRIWALYRSSYKPGTTKKTYKFQKS